MKRLLILSIVVASMMSSCGNQAEMEKLGSQKDSLSVVVAMKDSIINDAFININDIASTLNQITEREKLVTKQTSGDLNKTTKQQISENIAAISELLEKNRAAIGRLQASSAKLKQANVQIEGLQQLVASLQQQLLDKDAQIEALAEQIKALNIQVADLGTSVKNLEQDKSKLEGTVSEQTQQLNTVYYIVGNEKKLMKSEIIDKQGFIGRTRVAGANADLTEFTKSDLRTLERIAVGGKKVKIVTNHPQNSYMLVMGSKGVVEEIVITDKNEFWKNSKILIVSYK